MLGYFNPNLGQIWTSPNKNAIKNVQLKVKVEITFLTQHLGLSIFDPNLGSNNPALFRVQNTDIISLCVCKWRFNYYYY